MYTSSARSLLKDFYIKVRTNPSYIFPNSSQCGTDSDNSGYITSHEGDVRARLVLVCVYHSSLDVVWSHCFGSIGTTLKLRIRGGGRQRCGQNSKGTGQFDLKIEADKNNEDGRLRKTKRL